MSKNDEFKKGHSPLTDHDKVILDFEAQPFKNVHHKAEAIFQHFGYSPTRHYQLLNTIIDKPEAAEHSPVLVNRLRRQRDQRSRNRSAKRLGMNL